MNLHCSRTSFAPSSILPVWVRPSFSIILRRGRAHLFHSPYLYFSGPETTLCLLPRPNMATCRLEWEWTALVLLRPRSDLPHFFFSSRLPSCYNAEPYATDRPPARMPACPPKVPDIVCIFCGDIYRKIFTFFKILEVWNEILKHVCKFICLFLDQN